MIDRQTDLNLGILPGISSYFVVSIMIGCLLSFMILKDKGSKLYACHYYIHCYYHTVY